MAQSPEARPSVGLEQIYRCPDRAKLFGPQPCPCKNGWQAVFVARQTEPEFGPISGSRICFFDAPNGFKSPKILLFESWTRILCSLNVFPESPSESSPTLCLIKLRHFPKNKFSFWPRFSHIFKCLETPLFLWTSCFFFFKPVGNPKTSVFLMCAK